MTTANIRAVERRDIAPIKQLAIDNQMFGPDEVGSFDGTIGGHLDGTLPSTIRDDYGPGDAKVTYWKAMNR